MPKILDWFTYVSACFSKLFLSFRFVLTNVLWPDKKFSRQSTVDLFFGTLVRDSPHKTKKKTIRRKNNNLTFEKGGFIRQVKNTRRNLELWDLWWHILHVKSFSKQNGGGLRPWIFSICFLTPFLSLSLNLIPWQEKT